MFFFFIACGTSGTCLECEDETECRKCKDGEDSVENSVGYYLNSNKQCSGKTHVLMTFI